MRYVTDAGASVSGYHKEKNDCSVIAFAIALGLSYEETYIKLDAAGRKKNGGFGVVEFMEHCGFKGYETKEIKFKSGRRPTEAEFAKKYKKGNWVLYTENRKKKEGHVVAVINGMIFDPALEPSKDKVQYAWRLTKI